jgi:hypothetical protein
MAAVRLSTARSTAFTSPNATYLKPGTSGSKPCWYFSLGVAESAPSVRPWKAPRMVMMSTTSVARVSFAYFRASLIAASIASVPELQKNARSPNEWSTRSFARWICDGIW